MRNMLPHGSLRRAVRQHGEKRGNDMADFIKGMDLSTLLEVEACGGNSMMKMGLRTQLKF